MLKKPITYTDYNGEERTEDFYFNLTKAELMEMELSEVGGMTNMLSRIANAKDAPAIVKVFKELILKSYGEKSADGKRFMKKDENGFPLSRRFEETEAYSVLFMELSTNDNAATDFIRGIVPSDVSAALNVDADKEKN